jgi:ABC-2 type transport system permease protein
VRRVWHIATKELLQTRRDRLAALFTIVLPVVFTVFLGLIFGGANSGPGRLPLAMADADGTAASTRLVEQLKASPIVELKTMTAGEVDAAVQDQKVAAALVIPAGYGAALDAGAPVTLAFVRIQTSSGAQSLSQAVQAVVGELNSRLLVARTAADQVSLQTGKALDPALLSSAETLAAAALATPTVTVKTVDSANATVQIAGGFEQASAGSLVNWVLFSLLTVATGLAWERRQGLLRRLSSTGVRGRQIIGGKMLAMVIITFLQQLFLILLGQFAFGVDYLRSPLALLMVMVSLSVLAASFGLLISSAFRSEQAVIATTVISAQLLAVLGGAWFPLEITSGSFSRVAHFLPTAWVVDSLHGIILKGWGAGNVLAPMGIVWAWIVVVFALAAWRFRPE